jgi:hypothetical protein
MAGVVTFGAVTVGFAALSGSAGNGATAEIAESGNLAEQVGSFGLQLRQGIGDEEPPAPS